MRDRSIKTLKDYVLANIYKTENGCWLWMRRLEHGYGRACWNKRRFPATHAAISAFMGYEVPEELEVLHLCDNRSCVNPEHLVIGTHLQNVRHTIAQGKANYSGVTKIPKEEYDRIVQMRKTKSAHEIGIIYRVSSRTIRNIVQHHTVSMDDLIIESQPVPEVQKQTA